jgi:hypothetical protein
MMKKYDGDRHQRFYPPFALKYWLQPSAPLEEAALPFLRLWCDENVEKDVAVKVAKEVVAIADLMSLSDNDYATFLDIHLNHQRSDPIETGYYVKYPDL